MSAWLSLWSLMFSSSGLFKGRNGQLLKMVTMYNKSMYFSVNYVLDDFRKFLHCSFGLIWAVFLTAQKLLKSSAVLVIYFYLHYRLTLLLHFISYLRINYCSSSKESKNSWTLLNFCHLRNIELTAQHGELVLLTFIFPRSGEGVVCRW